MKTPTTTTKKAKQLLSTVSDYSSKATKYIKENKTAQATIGVAGLLATAAIVYAKSKKKS